jgi:hypothetical protein
MALKYQTETLEGLPEAVHDFYEQGENGYTLKVEGVVPESQFKEVNQKAVDNATEAQRRRKTVERVLSKLGLENADGLDDALDGLLNAPKGKNDADQKAIVEQMREKYEGQLKEANGKLQSVLMRGAQSELKSAILAARFHPEIADDITATAMSRVQLDDSGNLRIMQADNSGPLGGSGPDGFATFADLAKELAAAKPSFLVDAGKGGGGKPPASGSKGGAQTVTRSQFDAMSHADRATFSKSGGKVVDG